MILKYVTMTGADENTDVVRMSQLSEKYNFVEWGILISAAKKGEQKYPSKEWVNSLWQVNNCLKPLNLSYHICGSLARKGMNGDVHEQWYDFVPSDKHNQRVQLNVNATRYKCDFTKFVKFINYFFYHKNVIIQENGANRGLWFELIKKNPLINLNVLYDSSGGHGVEISNLQKPIPGILTGYAGGLGPDNIKEFLPKLNKLIGEGVCWIDMENNIRTNGEFDFDKIEFVLEACKNYAY